MLSESIKHNQIFEEGLNILPAYNENSTYSTYTNIQYIAIGLTFTHAGRSNKTAKTRLV